ncbi:MAG: type VI secretion system tip protein VgrG [Polyangiaceae bacterium]|nr:type VI secretion system tip protein VgrG [Polyangiaceae bacterium]
MTAPSPIAVGGSRVSFVIKANGKDIDSSWQVLSIDTHNTVNKVPRATVVLYDGSASERTFPISDSGTLKPGVKLQIAAGYDGKTASIFEGIIVRQGIEIDTMSGSKLIIEAADKALGMTLERSNAVFENVTDSDVISKLITASGLSKDVASTSVKHEEIVQYYASDWDTMVTRAELCGMVVITTAAKVTVKPPDTSQSPVLSLEYGTSILDLQAEIDSTTQYSSSALTSYSWDYGTQALVESGPGTVSVKEPGKLSSTELAKVFNVKKAPQQTGASLEKAALQAWSSAELLKSKLSKIRGRVRFQGTSLAATGKTVELLGLGDQFNGNAYVSGVHHSIRDNFWTTTATIGLSYKWFAAEAPNIAAPGASGQLPPISGLQTGIVKQVGKDKAGEHRVAVSIPLLQAGSAVVWARVASFYASNKVGAVFFPEVGDEVIVGFMNDDPRAPVILGSVYSKKLAPPFPPDDKNNKKAIVTRSKLTLSFDEQNKIIEISTPGKHTIKMDDKSGAISIEDSNKNQISLSKGGITLNSASNIKITAKGNITLDAKGNLSATAAANATMEGLAVSHKAKTKFSAQGTASAEVTSSGILTIRGTLVKIN